MDLQILYALQNIHTDWLNPIMVFITHLGDTGQIWIVTAVFQKNAQMWCVYAVGLTDRIFIR